MKVMLIGESWTKHTIHVKGFDSFTTSEYEEGIHWFQEAMREADFDFTYIRGHEIEERFPTKLEELETYDAIIISDIGSNSFLLPSQTFNRSETSVNRLSLIAEYTKNGGGFAMIGGYLSFQGIDAKAKYKGSAIEEILPVSLLHHDDRIEVPEGASPVVIKEHEIIKDVEGTWPHFLGFNELVAKKDAEVIMEIGKEHPFLVAGTYGAGKTLAFASDMAPHWGPPQFMNWEYYNTFWKNFVHWLA